jgi:hypothetical protein
VKRERLVAEAVAVIGTDGLDALSMRGRAIRLGVVPGALYRHVRSNVWPWPRHFPALAAFGEDFWGRQPRRAIRREISRRCTTGSRQPGARLASGAF